MAEIIRMPRMSDTMEEGVIAKWLKNVGDTVKSGDALAEVETDKATMELESYQDGTLLYLGVKERQSVPVDGVLAIIGKKGENIEEVLNKIRNEPVKIKSAKSIKPEKIPSAAESKPDTTKIKATVITMPRMSDTMTEGTISKWIKKVGDNVKSGDVLAEVETDKATMELEAFDSGTLLYIGIKEGSSVVVDGVIAIVGEKDADYQLLLKEYAVKHTQEKISGKEDVLSPAVIENSNSKPVKTGHVHESAVISHQTSSLEKGDGRIIVSPLARRLATELGYDLKNIKGSGENGRIVKKDIESFKEIPVAQSKASKAGSQPVLQQPVISMVEAYEEIPVSAMRKTIARRLSESKYSSPHFYITMEINMDNAIETRKLLNEDSPVKISFNDLIIKACGIAIRYHQKINSSWLGDKIRVNKHIHIGVAVAVEEGLLVPVIKFADSKSLSQISVEVKDLGNKARNKQLQPEDWEGNTFTISNLGMFGVEEFTAIINPPDSCILAVGGIKQIPVARGGQVVIGNVMKVTLSCDHRVVDGASGASFLQTLKNLLENPVKMLF